MDGRPMPTIDLTDNELAAVIAALRQVIDDDGYRHSPRLLPFKSLLAKLDPTSAPTDTPPGAYAIPYSQADARQARGAKP
jgi:hypothetical protein